LSGTVFQPSDFAIINTDGHSDFEVENSVTLLDRFGKKLDLKLNYVYVLCLSKFLVSKLGL
jgi:vacuolar protein sorting-associated protein 13A/C